MYEGIYEEIINKKVRRQLTQLSPDEFDIETERLDVEEARKLLASYISTVTRKALSFIRDHNKKGGDALLDQIQVCNEVIDLLSRSLGNDEFRSLQIEEKGDILTSIYHKLNTARILRKDKPLRPITPLSQTSLFTGSQYEPNMLEELRKEIMTSDSIDWLISFIKWSGLRIIMEELRHFTEDRGGKLRIITTSYMEATDFKAIEELSKLNNTEIRISYDKERTRLHAKAYLFKRNTGFSTAYIGSSNLSNPALTSGLEWNLKITEKESFDVLKKFEATFESYWNDTDFKLISKDNPDDWRNLKLSLSKPLAAETNEEYVLDVRPYSYQQEILEALEAERVHYGRTRNLVVAATGVGKTVISAFDFQRFYKQYPKAKFLFIAHREEILKQSLKTYRTILRNQNFGELLVGSHIPRSLDHLFMSIQSWNSKNIAGSTTPDFYDFIVVDEFHHASANTYTKLLNHYHPKVLLGLTATPERMDGQNVLTYFDDQIASEMRLPEAIDRKLLSPFHYFAVTDSVDLSALKWSKRGYDLEELENVYTGNRHRSELIVRNVKKYVTNIQVVKGLGFCVTVRHAEYMAKFFNEKGIPSIALHGGSNRDVRAAAKQKLVNGEINFIFVVDLYNEGIDIPEIDTILFLRPTESLTVFLQQLGRGLRLYPDKECLTALDFIGQAHKDYPFEEKFRALIGQTKHSIRKYVEEGFFHTPKGSEFILEKQAKEYILRNIKTVKHTKQYLQSKMKHFEEDTGKLLTLDNFLTYYQLTLDNFYGSSGDRLFERMKVDAGAAEDYTAPLEKQLMKRIRKLFHIDSAAFIQFLLRYVETFEANNPQEKRMVWMLYYSLFIHHPLKEGFDSTEQALKSIFSTSALKKEVVQLLTFRLDHLSFLERPHELHQDIPLRVHAHYTLDQAMAAFGYYNEEKSPKLQAGVKYFPDIETDVFFVTLNKSDKDFSPSTMYEDYAINSELFHWQSQNQTKAESKTGQRYINHKKTDSKIALFVREYRTGGSPFIFLGTASYVRHEGSEPVSIIWRLHEPMPAKIVPKANKNII
ncbi:DEAD/DEAH box helicase [Jeotgalibacillus soli]|nr:DEAD/DEAH box helicase [Jeotgalibacillus soli]